MVNKDYLGLDAVSWVLRLREVNSMSSFPAADRVLIEEYLTDLQRRLENLRS